ncbi:FABP family protein [Corynebacterium comes]|uniref:Ferric nitrobindin-like protein n=1 Tax=Corynebacterium comes TaxID=2675218 RepID=A0A6B8VWK7_9CORY|nr:FABP family protein [Corynebacterium comes]QGU04481.1 hypothetical protein CETAM_06075 [Corynebacterium comes]
MELHPNLQPYAFLLGTWKGEGRGYYPTIDDFSYSETLTFAATPGKPFFRYEQKTMGAGGPMHTEAGFFRPVGEGRLEFVIAQPMGQTELLAGQAREEGDTLIFEFDPSTVANSPTAKQVDATSRSYTFNADRTSVKHRFHMGAVGQPMQQHLESELVKTD